ncbi:4-hydroxythreonine-4-phosphate dehydrogenase PdxA [Nibricoccus sp. IMCC34717]|uniref:4-hydroxythreonine-4-phosphate dehydrogenase PdxA n=1 Tax=Nibricoccus sp. IMCC34717 TaxID=3034021 RepID=UPI00384BBA7E
MTAAPPLALACGDLAGVGPELIARWLATQSDSRGFCAFGPASWLATLPRTGLQLVATASPSSAVVPGQPSVAAAAAGVAALEAAAEAVRSGQCSGVVTAPISKEWAQRAGFAFPGQTEFFEARWGGEAVMTFGGGRLRVALATWHIPLAAVSATLTPAHLTRAVAAVSELAEADGIVAPRIAVCGLNPHAGEAGLLGTEERDWIDSTLAALARGTPGLLPMTVPGDTAFARALRGEFDGIVALYHDQGLAPLKAVDFDESVNVTLGLPWVRTSPDHGTAFSLAGRGTASISSWANAVTLAQRLIIRRSGR